jgi:hypothetical protein
VTEALDTRLTKLEAKRRVHDGDLSRLSDEELQARIDTLRERVIAEEGGTIEAATEALRSDPACRIIVEDLERRRAETT